MTKPHTTLSEAVRAMASMNPHAHGTFSAIEWDDGFNAALSAAADLVEKAEEEKPIDRAIRTGEPELFSFAPDQSSVRVVWPNGEVSLYVAESAEGREPVGTVVEMPGSGGGFTMCAFKASDVAVGSRLYAQPTLAATQAGDAKDAARYRWLLNNYAFGDGYNSIDSALNYGEADKYLSQAIDAAMSPTTTRSE